MLLARSRRPADANSRSPTECRQVRPEWSRSRLKICVNLSLRMPPLSYRSPKTEVRQSAIHGRGLFATADIAKDEVVAIKGGHIVGGELLRHEITPRLGPVEIQIDDDL